MITRDRPRSATPPPAAPRGAPARGRPRNWLPGVVGPLIVALVATGMYVGLKAAYGGFGHYYEVSVGLPRTGQQLTVGSDVRMRGVIIGAVKQVQLVDRRARLILQIDQKYRVPTSARADVDLTTLLGAKFINLRFDRYAAPWLENGAQIAQSRVGPELEDALDDGVSVLQAIRPAELGTVVSELTTASRGHGDDVARGFETNAELSSLFARTLDPQLESLRDFEVIFRALRSSGVDLNNLADAINQGVPVYASKSAQAALDKALRAVTPFADNLGDLVILNRSDWDRMFDSGDRVLQTIADRPEGLRDLVHGLYQYMYRLSGDPCTRYCGLGDGSGAAGFANFMGGNSQRQMIQQICSALPLELRKRVPACQGGLG